eukprot:421719-Alexandrium_andersonii.AAC.1
MPVGQALNSANPCAAGSLALVALGNWRTFGGSAGRGVLLVGGWAACVALRCRWVALPSAWPG